MVPDFREYWVDVTRLQPMPSSVTTFDKPGGAFEHMQQTLGVSGRA